MENKNCGYINSTYTDDEYWCLIMKNEVIFALQHLYICCLFEVYLCMLLPPSNLVIATMRYNICTVDP